MPVATPATSALPALPDGRLAAPAPQEPPAGPRPTAHPPLPAKVGDYWLVPAPGWPAARADAVSAARALAHAATLIDEEKYTQALSFIRRTALASTPLAGYAAYLTGVAEFELERLDAATRTFTALRAANPPGYLAEAATLQLAEICTTQRDYAAAVGFYEEALSLHTGSRR